MWLLAAILAAFAIVIFVVGVRNAWIAQGDFDMQERVVEYNLFRAGYYPDPGIDEPPSWSRRTSPYPPYAFALFGIFFEPGGLEQGRLLLEGLSLAAMIVMGAWAWPTFVPSGTAVAAVAAVAGAAIAGNGNAMAMGQFSVISMGLIAQSMIFLDRRRPIPAGICWALAMIKPQIAIVFAILFFRRGNLRGLFSGILLLGFLTLAVCVWTDVSVSEIVGRWTFGMAVMVNAHGGFPLAVTSRTGISTTALTLLILVPLAVAAVAWVRRRGVSDLGRFELLLLAGIVAVGGALALYHRHYDYIMLWPTLMATFAVADQRRDRLSLAMAATLLATLVVPERLLAPIPLQQEARWLVWGATAVFLAIALTRTPGPAGSQPA